MKKSIYFDMSSGISGDMILCSLLILSNNVNKALEQVKKIAVPVEFNLKISIQSRNHISVRHIEIEFKNNQTHKHSHRYITDIEKIISESDISEKAKRNAMNIFHAIAEAESKAHDIPVDKVHFHEVGALDSIIDITGSAILFDYLNIETVLYGPFLIGSGTINYSHGKCSLPVPAVSELLKNRMVMKLDIPQELVTPTGAAILTTLGTQVKTFSGEIINTVRVCGEKNIERTPGYSQVYIFDHVN